MKRLILDVTTRKIGKLSFLLLLRKKDEGRVGRDERRQRYQKKDIFMSID